MECASNSRPDFDRVASWYRCVETVCAGGLMARARRAFLADVSRARRLLLVGEGPGGFLAELCRSGSEARITVLDSSQRMLARARRNCGRAGGCAGDVTWVHGDVLEVDLPRGGFDAVATHFFLDCLEEHALARLASRMSAWTLPGALWAVTDFCIPSGPMAVPARALVAMLYAAFGLMTGLRTRRLVDPAPVLSRAGWKRERQHHFAAGLLRADLHRFAGPGE